MQTRTRRVPWSPAVSIDERVLLHLLELGPDARPPARVLAGALQCQGRRYEELSAALERLVADGSVDHAQRPGTTSRRDRGYALTPRGHLQTESLRRTSDSQVSTNREEAEACPKGATVFRASAPRGNRKRKRTRDAREGKGRTVQGHRSWRRRRAGRSLLRVYAAECFPGFVERSPTPRCCGPRTKRGAAWKCSRVRSVE